MVFSLFLKSAYMSQCNIPLHLSKNFDYSLMLKFQHSLTKKKSISVHINTLQFAQNALEGPVLDPNLENCAPLPPTIPHGLDTPKTMDTPLTRTNFTLQQQSHKPTIVICDLVVSTAGRVSGP